MRKQDKYRKKLEREGMIRVTGYVPKEDREKVLRYMKRQRDAARKVA